ncbi:MAG: diacylglycerol kinase family lipid kinase [Deltaproteobacteria bacterium]|nr:diacylglycerol kinase family lipid kinase [Deltaproteobacteria bacterium]
MRPHLIVNPMSANGRTGRHFDAIASAVRAALGDFEWAFTRRRGDGAVLAREAVAGGSRLVVAVGGDGTASEVVDGLATARDPQVCFGFIPRGTGGDLKRSIGAPADTHRAARALRGEERVCDLGRVEFVGHDGTRQVRHFANVAGCGIDGRVVEKVEGSTKLLGGKAAFQIGAARALLGWKDQRVRWRTDGGPWREEAVTCIAVCNGRYFGGGMMVAPDARIDDGLFDVTVWQGLGIADFLVRRHTLYDGSHLRLPNTRTLRARTVEIEPLDGARVLLDVDGEGPGTLPARFTILPGALRLKVPFAGA